MKTISLKSDFKFRVKKKWGRTIEDLVHPNEPNKLFSIRKLQTSSGANVFSRKWGVIYIIERLF
jgi:hypothetical protein